VTPWTFDSFFDGRVHVAQPQRGYRYSIDAVLLAALPNPKSGERVLDLGTGCGIIPLLMTYRNPGLHITGVEVQPELARLAEMNVANNGMQDRIRIIQHDLRCLSLEMVGGPVDWIVSNPPYRRAASGRVNPDAQRALARHEINLDLHQLIKSSRRLLKTAGRFAAVYPCERLVELLSEMHGQGLEPKRLRCVHSQAGDAAKLALVQGVGGAKPGLKIDAPLMIYAADGQYSEALRDIMQP
jgi:tRNA1(Val) A37 N6-methylase TrmN6